jgi:sarcosine oxidase subunit beta
LPILGPVKTTQGVTIEGATVASAGGHGMMWGPGVARVAADLALEGRSSLIDVAELGMDRFDERGRSPFYDKVALPFPPSADDD